MHNKLVHVINIKPLKVDDKVPTGFIKALAKKGKLQNREFTLKVNPLNHIQHVTYTSSRYNQNTLISIFNNHIEFIDNVVDLKYIMKYPLLIKAIVDAIFSITEEQVSKMNTEPSYLFSNLKKKREMLYTVDFLMDRLVINILGHPEYLKYRKIDNFEERLSFVAMLEATSGVIIEERWNMSNKVAKPIDLTIKQNFDKEYQHMFPDQTASNSSMLETQNLLSKQIQEDKYLEELGIKRRINISEENSQINGD